MIAWFKKHFGRRSRIDMLVRALPNPERLRLGSVKWLETLRTIGDAGMRWEPEDSVLLDAVRQLADAADLLGPMIGSGMPGEEKYEALVAQLRMLAAGIGMADDAFDAFWLAKGRPILESYITRLRG